MNIKREDLHFIAHNGQTLILHIPSFSICKVSSVVGEMFKGYYIQNKGIGELSSNYKVEKEHIKNLFSSFEDKMEERTVSSAGYASRSITRLNLNVAHTCNLRCKYCYALYGTYGGTSALMGEKVVSAVADFFLENFDEIGTIAFFGGEPMLNPPAIEKTCEYFTNGTQKKGIKPPKFVILTNGTIISREIIGIINKYHINLTIAIDGPEVIHNALRKFVNGRGSLKRIVKNIELLREHTDVELWYEAAYTKLHIRMGISREEVREFINKEIGITKGVVAETFAPKMLRDELLDTCFLESDFLAKKNYYKKYTKKVIQEILEGKTLDTDIGEAISYFIKREPHSHLCLAGRQTFTVTPNGNVYPCQFFIAPRFLLCNVLEGNAFKLRGESVQKLFDCIDKRKNLKCKSCWLCLMCETCIGQFYQENEELKIPDYYCSLIQKKIETVVKEISDIFTSPETYRKFVENFNNLSRDVVSR